MIDDFDPLTAAARSPRAARAAALLGAAAPLAAALAFTAAPAALAASPLPGGPAASATRPAFLVGDLCRAAVQPGALLPSKWPDCAGD
jgi:hypothetical protein